MNSRKSEAHSSSELYELLALMTIGACCWFIGGALGILERLSRFADEHNLMSLVMLSGCVGLGAIAAMGRTSIQLRRAVAARMKAEAVAEQTARHDALTGLANRRLFNESLEGKLIARKPDEKFAVMLIDLDRFKPINDIHGHAAGNAVLCAVAERLLAIAPRGSLVSRLGGDEFAVLLNSPTDEAGLAKLAQQTIDAVRRRIVWNQGHVEVGATVGIALATSETTDPGSPAARRRRRDVSGQTRRARQLSFLPCRNGHCAQGARANGSGPSHVRFLRARFNRIISRSSRFPSAAWLASRSSLAGTITSRARSSRRSSFRSPRSAA